MLHPDPTRLANSLLLFCLLFPFSPTDFFSLPFPIKPYPPTLVPRLTTSQRRIRARLELDASTACVRGNQELLTVPSSAVRQARSLGLAKRTITTE